MSTHNSLFYLFDSTSSTCGLRILLFIALKDSCSGFQQVSVLSAIWYAPRYWRIALFILLLLLLLFFFLQCLSVRSLACLFVCLFHLVFRLSKFRFNHTRSNCSFRVLYWQNDILGNIIPYLREDNMENKNLFMTIKSLLCAMFAYL